MMDVHSVSITRSLFKGCDMLKKKLISTIVNII